MFRTINRGVRPLVAGAALLAGACGGYDAPGGGTSPPTRVLTTVTLELAANLVEIGQETGAKASSFDQYGDAIASGAATYTSSAPEVAAVQPATGTVIGISPGTAQITGTIGGKMAKLTLAVFKPPVRLNEIKPAGSDAPPFVELFNPAAEEVNVSGWIITGSDINAGFTLPDGVTIPAGGFRVINATEIPGGLPAAGAVHLFNRFGVQVDAFVWPAAPPATFGRCPDGAGPFLSNAGITRGGLNACG